VVGLAGLAATPRRSAGAGPHAGRRQAETDRGCTRFLRQDAVRSVAVLSSNELHPGGANRKVLERIRETGTISHAWSDQRG